MLNMSPYLKLFLVTEKTGYEEIKEGPQLQHVVLNRRSREDEPMVGNQLLDGFRRLSLSVLNDVPFVQDAVIPAQRSEKLQIVSYDVVGGDDEVVTRDLLTQAGPLRWRSGVVQRAQMVVRDEFLHFVDPMTRQRRRADHNRR